MGEMGVWDDTEWRWDLRWRRDRFVWESSLERDLIMLLSRVIMRKNVQDIQVWGKEIPGLFSVSLAYECLSKHGRGNNDEVFKLLWKVKAFPNVLVTTWRVFKGRIPTRVSLSQRGMMLNSTVCPLCLLQEETCQHLFMVCKYAQQVWSQCLQWVGISFVEHHDLKRHFLSFHLF